MDRLRNVDSWILRRVAQPFVNWLARNFGISSSTLATVLLYIIGLSFLLIISMKINTTSRLGLVLMITFVVLIGVSYLSVVMHIMLEPEPRTLLKGERFPIVSRLFVITAISCVFAYDVYTIIVHDVKIYELLEYTPLFLIVLLMYVIICDPPDTRQHQTTTSH